MREKQIETLRQARLEKAVRAREFQVGQSVEVAVTQFDRLAGKISSVSGSNVEVLLEMEILGQKIIKIPSSRVASVNITSHDF
jgi:hypothetical protein